MIKVIKKECAICHEHNVGLFNEKLILKDHGRLCKHCAQRLFTKPKSFGAMEWASQHTTGQVRRLLAAHHQVDVKQWQQDKKTAAQSQKSLYESLRQQYVHDHAQRLGQCYFNPARHTILFPPIHAHTHKVIDDDFIIGYTPIEKGHFAQQQPEHAGFSTSGHDYQLVDRLGIVITLRNGATYLVDFIKNKTKQGYTTERAYHEFQLAQNVLAAIVRKNNQALGATPLHVSSI